MENFAQKALEAFWNEAYKDMPVPEVDGITFSRNGRSITFSGPGFTETSDLTNLVQVIEKVWWRLGWSDLTPVSSLNNPYCFFDLPENTYESLGSDITRFCKELDEKDAIEVLCIIQNIYAVPEVQEAVELLQNFEKTEIDKLVYDDTDTFTNKIFDGRRKASELTLLKSLVNMLEDSRPLQRRQCVKEAAQLVNIDSFIDLDRIIPVATTIFDAAENDKLCIREVTAHLANAIAEAAIDRNGFEYAIPFLDYCVEHGPRFALQHANRWMARHALGLEGAEEDWGIFSGCVHKTGVLFDNLESQKEHLKVWRLNGLYKIANAALNQRDGLPTFNTKKKKPIQVPVEKQKQFENIGKTAAKEALQLLEEINIDTPDFSKSTLLKMKFKDYYQKYSEGSDNQLLKEISTLD